MADAVRAYGRGVPNYRGAQIPVSSLFNLPAWESYLKAYDDKIVVDFLQFGWPINCDTTVLPKSTFKNHGSAAGANGQLILRTYICKELSYHSVCGPYHCNPFNTDCVISPLQCVPKRDSPAPRIVHDLSFPPDASVNSCIPSDSFLNEPYKLQLPGIDRLVSFVNQLGRGATFSKKTSNGRTAKFLWIRLIIISLACALMAYFIFIRLYLLVCAPLLLPASAQRKQRLLF